MDTLFKPLLILHIAGGALGLITGTINIIRTKGDKKHRLIGKLFTYGMLTAGLSSLVLSAIHPNFFLFIVGVFTTYLVATGNRYIYLKMLGSSQRPAMIDWVITVGMLLTGLVFMGFGVKYLIDGNNFGFVLLVFGGLGLRFVRTDFSNYKGNVKAKNYWLLAHLQRMIGGYTAAATAFLVVNEKYWPVAIPSILAWLLPTLVLTPLIILWSRKYKAKAAVDSVRVEGNRS